MDPAAREEGMRMMSGPLKCQMPFIYDPVCVYPLEILHSGSGSPYFKDEETEAWVSMIMSFTSKDYYFSRTFLGSKSPVLSTLSGCWELMSTKLLHVLIQPPRRKCQQQSSYPPHRHTSVVTSSTATLPKRLGKRIRTLVEVISFLNSTVVIP